MAKYDRTSAWSSQYLRATLFLHISFLRLIKWTSRVQKLNTCNFNLVMSSLVRCCFNAKYKRHLTETPLSCSFLLRQLKVSYLRKIVFPTSVLFILTRPHEFLTRDFSLAERGIETALLFISTCLFTDAEHPILCLHFFHRFEKNCKESLGPTRSKNVLNS